MSKDTAINSLPQTQGNHIVSKPNSETTEALLEAKKLMSDPNAKAYSVEEALKELNS